MLFPVFGTHSTNSSVTVKNIYPNVAAKLDDSGRIRATFEVLGRSAVELNGNQVICLGCPRNGKRVWAYQVSNF